MIRLEGMTKSYRIGQTVRTIYENVSLDVPGDRRVAILGPTGAGKTVLIRLLCGLETPSEGVITRFTKVSFPVGYSKGLKYNLSAMQNIAFAARVYGGDVGEISDFVARTTELGLLLEEPLRRLSILDRGMVSFALGYGLPFQTYLLDHVMAYGTPEFRTKCMAMYEGRARDAGIIFATRHRRTAERLCDCGIVISGMQLHFYDNIIEALEAFEQVEQTRAADQEMTALDQDLDGAELV